MDANEEKKTLAVTLPLIIQVRSFTWSLTDSVTDLTHHPTENGQYADEKYVANKIPTDSKFIHILKPLFNCDSECN